MKRFPLNKTLLWKEWRQNRWLLAILFLFVTSIPTIETMLEWLKSLLREMVGVPDVDRVWYTQFGFANAWSFVIGKTINGLLVTESGNAVGYHPLFPMALIAVWIWGILMVARERTPNTLEFLAASPVSRREIAVTKWFFGAVSVVGMMTVNLLFVVGMALVEPAGYTLSEAVLWYIYLVSVLLAAFTLGFLIGIVTGNLLAALGAACLFLFLRHGVDSVLAFFAPGYEPTIHKVTAWLDYLQPLTYLTLYQGGDTRLWWYAAMLLAVSLMLCVVSVRLFEVNPLEHSGRVLMFGNPRLFWVFFVPLVPAVVLSLFLRAVLRDVFWDAPDWIGVLLFVGFYVVGVVVASYLMRQLKGHAIGVR